VATTFKMLQADSSTFSCIVLGLLQSVGNHR